MIGLVPLVTAELDRMERERGVASNRQIMSDLRRAFRGLRDRLPQYELPAVDSEGAGPADVSRTSGLLPLGESDGEGAGPVPPEAEGAESDGAATLELFPPGPLAAAAIQPAELELAPGRERRVRAVATDEAGRRLDAGDLQFDWRAESEVLAMVGSGPRPALLATPAARVGARVVVHLTVRQGERVATASATVSIVEAAEPEAGAKLGIPRPELLDEPGAGWRSRFLGQRWQVNAGHEDFAALAGDPRARLRYLLTLLAKEIVSRTHGGPGADPALEGLVEILAHTERNLRGRLEVLAGPSAERHQGGDLGCRQRALVDAEVVERSGEVGIRGERRTAEPVLGGRADVRRVHGHGVVRGRDHAVDVQGAGVARSGGQDDGDVVPHVGGERRGTLEALLAAGSVSDIGDPEARGRAGPSLPARSSRGTAGSRPCRCRSRRCAPSPGRSWRLRA